MGISVKNGPFIRSRISTLKINISLIVCLLLFNLYRIIIDGIKLFIPLLIIISSLFIANLIYDLVFKKQVKFIEYINVLITSLITSLLIPNGVSYITIFLTTLITGFIGKLFKINEISLNLGLLLIFNNNVPTQYNLYIFLPLLIISIIILIYNRAFKFRICFSYIFVLLIFFILKIVDINSLFMLLLIGVFLIPYYKASPNTSLVQYIYGLLLGLICVFCNNYILYILISILSIVFMYIDFWNSCLLSRRNV